MKTTFLVRSTSYGDSPFRRFDLITAGSGKRTVVKIKKGAGVHTITTANIKWTKCCLINKFIKLYCIIRYSF